MSPLVYRGAVPGGRYPLRIVIESTLSLFPNTNGYNLDVAATSDYLSSLAMPMLVKLLVARVS